MVYVHIDDVDCSMVAIVVAIKTEFFNLNLSSTRIYNTYTLNSLTYTPNLHSQPTKCQDIRAVHVRLPLKKHLRH